MPLSSGIEVRVPKCREINGYEPVYARILVIKYERVRKCLHRENIVEKMEVFNLRSNPSRDECEYFLRFYPWDS